MTSLRITLIALLIAGSTIADEAKVKGAIDLLAKQRSGVALTAAEQAVIGKAAWDWTSVRDIRDRGRRGETLTADEKRLIALALELRAQRAAEGRAAYRKEHPPKSSTGLVPLSDLGDGVYKGEGGGLYPGGQNAPPTKHLDAGLKLAASVVPLGPDGSPSSDGWLVSPPMEN